MAIISRFFIAMLLLFVGFSTAIEAQYLDDKNEFYTADECISEASAWIDVDAYAASILSDERFSDFIVSDRNQIIICRHIVEASPAAILAWPAFSEKFVFSFGSQVSKNFSEPIEALIRSWSQSFRKTYGVQLSHPIQVIVASNADDAFELISNIGPSSVSKSGFEAAFEVTCSSIQTAGGFSFFNFIVLCFNPNLSNVGEFESDLIVTYLHEEVHAIQYQLTGQPAYNGDERRLARMGPEWLLEGSAELLALRFFHGDAKLEDHLRQVDENEALQLNEMRLLGDYASTGELAYRFSAAAVRHLLYNRSAEEIFNFYETLGRGAEWSSSFNEIFDVSIDDFEEGFN